MSRVNLRRNISQAYYQIWLPRKYSGTFSQRLRWFQANQGKTTNEIAILRWSLVKRVLDQAAVHVPYYRDVFQKAGLVPEAIKDERDFARLPMLRREDIQERLESLVSKNQDRGSLIVSTTSGSTGTPMHYYHDKEYYRQNEAMAFRNRLWTGWNYGEAILRYWGSPIDLDVNKRLRAKIDGWLRNETMVDAYDMSAEALSKWPEVLQQVKPSLIEGYTNALVVLGEILQSSGINPHVRTVISTAETLFPLQRELIEKVFGCRVFNRYGTREISTIAHECRFGRLHIIEDWVYVEVVDEAGNPLPAGETGQVVVTAFYNMAMPFIRYAVGDVGSLAEASEGCECGLPFRWLEQLEGRVQDLVTLPAGGYASGEIFNHIIKLFPVRQFLIVQTGQNGTDVDIYIIPDEGFEPGMFAAMREKLQRYAPGLEMVFHPVESLPRMPSGKRRYTISHISGLDALYGDYKTKISQ